MTIDAVIAPELLSAEIEAIEDLLVHYEDWRALSQLEIRERQGEVPGGASTSALKAMLIEKLATNPLFLRRQTLLKELERLTQSVHTPGQPITVRPSKTTDDDLTRIRGIDARLERRLNALNIRSFAQIAAFNLDDVRYVSNTLGLENRIISQMWIEQAEMLTGTSARAVPVPEAFRPVDYAAGRAQSDAAPPPQLVAVEPVPPAAPAPVPPPVEVSVAVAKPAAPTPQARAPQGPVAPEPRAVEEKPPKAAAAPPPKAVEARSAETTPEEKSQPPSAEALRKPAVETRVESATAAAKASGTEDAAQLATPPLEAAKAGGGTAARAETRAKSEPQKLAAPLVDEPGASAPGVSGPAVGAAAEASAPAVAAPLYGDLVPPRPMAASQFKTVETEPVPVSSAQAKPAEAVVAVPEIDPAALKPASPLAAAKFAGAVLASHHDYALPDAKPPPKPRPPAAYVGEEKPPQSAPAPTSPQQGKAAATAAQPQPPSATSRDSSGGIDRRASTLATENLPPLPLKPAVPASSPPPLPRAQAAPSAGMQGSASAPPATLPSAAASAAAAAAAAQAAASAREAAMLAAAAARGSSTPPSGGPRIPPPLPPAAVLWPESQPQQPHPRTAPERPAGAEARELVNSNEASVTIRRLDDGTKGQQARAAGTTPVRAGRSERVEIENFDSSSYAAYHSEIEEASVQIVRRKDGPGTAQAAYVPPPPSQGAAPKPAPVAPERPAAKPLQPVPPESKAAEKAAAPIGRFLRALTGQ